MPRSDPAPRDPLLGARIDGRYTVHGMLGRGGMGVVYDGVHDELGRSVAIKVLNAAWASDPNAVARFLREARTAGSLSHGNIVDVSDLGRLPDGRPYLVMPKISGTDLAQLLRSAGRQPPKRVAELLSGAAAALDLIHAKGLVHRDIKPENLMYVVREDGSETVMLLDFGIAALVASNEPRLTRQGAIFGTPEYLPPEVWDGKLPDGRGDVYALATVAFELMTGELPFVAENVMHILPMKLKSGAPSMAYVSGIKFAETIEAVVARGLELDPNDRYRLASEFVNALRAATADAHVSWRPGDIRADPPRVAAAAPDALEEPLDTSVSRELASAGSDEDSKTFLDVPRPISDHPPTLAEAPLWENRAPPQANVSNVSEEADTSPREYRALGNSAPIGPLTSGSTELPVSTTRRILPYATVAVALLAVLAWLGTRSEPDSPDAAGVHQVKPAPSVTAPEPVPTEPTAAHDSEPTPAPTPIAPAETPPPSSKPRTTPAVKAAPKVEAAKPQPSLAIKQPAPNAPLSQPPVSKPALASAATARPKPTRDPAAAAQLTHEGTTALLSGQVAHAAELLRRALAADPSHAPAYRSLGLALERTGNTQGAIDAYDKYLKLDPSGAQSSKIRERLAALKK